MIIEGEQLKKLQGVCLELIKEVDRICRKNNIEYTLDSGTLLGAIREKGFIPWDDDADISFTRDQYEKFFEACKKDLNTEKYFLQEYRTDKEYPWGYSKLRMKGTTYVQIGQEHMKFMNGIFIDLFIYDPVPDNYFLRRLHHFACFLTRKCQYSAIGRLNAKNPIQRLIYKVLYLIPRSWVFAALDKLVEVTNRNPNTELVRHKTYPYSRKECYYGLPSKCYESYSDVEFEGETFRKIDNYDLNLSMLYGDYMTPPPVDERPHYPVAVIKFKDE